MSHNECGEDRVQKRLLFLQSWLIVDFSEARFFRKKWS